MSDQPLRRAHYLYDVAGEHVRRLIEKDPNYAELATTMVLFKSKLKHRLGPEEAERMEQALDLMLSITREHAFKLGCLMAVSERRAAPA